MFPLRLCGGKVLVAVTRDRRYGPSRLCLNDDDDEAQNAERFTKRCLSHQRKATMSDGLTDWPKNDTEKKYKTQLCVQGGSVAEWIACWTQAQKGLGLNRSRDAVG